MRISVRALAAVGYLSFTGAECCGVGGPELVPEREACASFYECSLAVKAEVFVVPTFGKGPVVAVDVDPPELLEVTLDGARLALRARQPGDGVLRARLEDGSVAVAWVRAAPLATTRVVPAGATAPSGPLAIYRGGELRLLAEHLDERGDRLLGHGFETWDVTGGTLREVDAGDTGLVPSLERIAIAGDAPAMSVTARPSGTPLAFDVVPPGATARLDLTVRGEHTSSVPLPPDRTVTLPLGTRATITIAPFTADDRPIHGLPTTDGLTVVSTDPSVIDAQLVPATRDVTLHARAPGEADLELRLDGQVVRFRVRSTPPSR
ncbi:MAG: hypothetical protein KIT31_12650 [Deltaproteobacteria bacterium]|nr:hypothetical protein [Deltaproteobacteria bacterium]